MRQVNEIFINLEINISNIKCELSREIEKKGSKAHCYIKTSFTLINRDFIF